MGSTRKKKNDRTRNSIALQQGIMREGNGGLCVIHKCCTTAVTRGKEREGEGNHNMV